MQHGPHDEGKGCAILTVPGCSRTIVSFRLDLPKPRSDALFHEIHARIDGKSMVLCRTIH